MRRGSSTIVAVVGETRDEVLAGIGGFPNVALVKPQGPGREPAMRALAEASGRLSPYVVVPADPLAEVAEAWRAMWDLGQGTGHFEVRGGEAIAAWRAGRFELPDYYLVITDEAPTAAVAPHPHDFYLGVLRAQRPARVVAVLPAGPAETTIRIAEAPPALPQGPWWPPLDTLIDAARTFFAGGLGR